MSPNSRYIKGRAFEYRRRDYWTSQGYVVIRSAGSKSLFDLVAIPLTSADHPIALIQCKMVNTPADAERICRDFIANNTLPFNPHYEQHMEVWVNRERKLVSCVI